MTARRRTPPRGWPVETHDDDVTPPPQEMPLPASSAGYDSIPPPIREQLDMLATGLGDVTRAIARSWTRAATVSVSTASTPSSRRSRPQRRDTRPCSSIA